MKLLADPDVDSQTKDIARKSAVSKARFPIDYTMSRAIKEYKLV
jgi:hypothetical protein